MDTVSGKQKTIVNSILKIKALSSVLISLDTRQAKTIVDFYHRFFEDYRLAQLLAVLPTGDCDMAARHKSIRKKKLSYV
jgi:hypothetical protein